MNTAGIDLSLTSTGLSISGQLFSIRSKLRGESRLIEIRDRIMSQLKEKSVEIVALEGYSYASRFSHAHSIGELGGVIKVALAEAGISVVIIPPSNRAKFATGRGNASKEDVVLAVLQMTSIPDQPGLDDVCDAWILEQMLQHLLGKRNLNLSEKQLAALETVEYKIKENTDGI